MTAPSLTPADEARLKEAHEIVDSGLRRYTEAFGKSMPLNAGVRALLAARVRAALAQRDAQLAEALEAKSAREVALQKVAHLLLVRIGDRRSAPKWNEVTITFGSGAGALAFHEAITALYPDGAGDSLPASAEPSGWRHRKRGTTYTVIGTAEAQVNDCILEGHWVVVYRSDADGKLWIRPTEEFYDGRFERLPPPPSADEVGR